LFTAVAAHADSSANQSAGATPLGFPDVRADDWFYPYLAELVAKQLVRGNADGTYAPNKLLFVDEFLAMALRTLGREQDNADGYWALNYIYEAIRVGLIDRGEYMTYDVPITREQIAKIATRALGNERFGDYMACDGVFSDLGRAADKVSILKAIDRGILAGYPDGTFRPRDNATRAEAAAIVVRMTDKSYRLERYGTVFFNARTDLNETGIMKKEKVYDFAISAIKTLRITTDASGKVVVSGVVPEVPKGQVFIYQVALHDKRGEYVGYVSTISEVEGEIIPWPGPYKITTAAKQTDVEMIHVTYGFATGKSYRELTNFSAAYILFRHYSDLRQNYFIRNEDMKITYYDFSIAERVWGW
jgi:hypothetical protein